MVYLYAAIAGSCDVLSGWFALTQGKARVEPRYVIAFAAGVLVAVTFFDILPNADLKSDATFLMLGFVVFYLLEKVMMIHACGETECDTHRLGPVAVFGMALDNVVDGAGIAVGYHIDPLLGFAITAAVVFHEIPQGLASGLIMREAGWSGIQTLATLLSAGLLYPIGALFAGFLAPEFQQKMLAFLAGDFIYIGASDLLPEAHRRFNWKVILSVILGMAFAILLKTLVPSA